MNGQPESAYHALADLIDKWRPADSPYGPGVYLVWFVSRHVKAEDVLFVDVLADRNRTLYDERYGRLFIVTRTDVVLVDYDKTVDDEPGANDGFGRASISFFPRTPGFLKSITWANRDLRMTDQSRRLRASDTTLEAGAIHVAGDGWEIDLPVEKRSTGGDEYFARLRQALATET